MNESKKTGSGRSRIKLAVILAASVTLFITTLHAMSASTVAQYVLGQTDFMHSNANYITASTMSSPSGVAIDKSSTPHHLYVADTSNNRVLGWNNAASFSNDQPADLVVGAGDFQSPGALVHRKGLGSTPTAIFTSPIPDTTACSSTMHRLQLVGACRASEVLHSACSARLTI